MSIVALLLVLALIGLLAWALTTYVPMDPPMKTVINVAAIILSILLVLSATGVMNGADFSLCN